MMEFTEKQAAYFLENYVECWMDIDVNYKIVYFAIIKSIDSPNLFNIEMGVETEDHKISTSLISTADLPVVCKLDKPIIRELDLDINLVKKINKEQKINVIIKNVEKITHQQISQSKIRPIISGSQIQSLANSSIYSKNSKSGTLGAFVKLKNDKSTYLLSNYHVLSEEELKYNDLIFQPEIEKSYNYSNTIGYLKFGHYGDTEDNKNTIDVAFAELIKSKLKNRITKGFIWSSKKDFNNNKVAILNSIEEPDYGMKVKIHGQSSWLREGTIKSINAWVKITHAYDKTKTKLFKNQILTDCLSMSGDSGSVLVNDNNNVVGLLHSGDKKNISISNNINHIFNQTYNCGSANYKIQFEKFLT